MSEPTILFLAPHAMLPATCGSDVRALEIARAFSKTFSRCYLLGRNRFLSWEGGEERVLCEPPSPKGSVRPALKSVFTGTHYLTNKHLGAPWQRVAAEWLERIQPEILYVHFLWAQPFASRWSAGRRMLIDTHNYDLEWFGNLARNTWNPLQKLACHNSIQVILRILRDLPEDSPLIHVSQRDADCYVRHRPDVEHLILPNGCTVRPRHPAPDYSVPRKRAYFLGGLSVQISLDALLVFEKTFWPKLHDVVEFHVVGANPTQRIKLLCRRHGWRLHENLPDDALADCLADMHFSLLPFTYGAGSKLKLVDAAGRGIPVVSTAAGVVGFDDLPQGIFVSDDLAAWRKRIVDTNAIPPDETEGLLRFGRRFSWESLVAGFHARHGEKFAPLQPAENAR